MDWLVDKNRTFVDSFCSKTQNEVPLYLEEKGL